jgi:hypothetical protein
MKIVLYKEGAVNLEEKDKQFIQLQELIDAKKQMLLQKQKKLRFITKQNHFLEEVKEDYENYCSFIIQQKRDQMKALEYLNNYIKQLTLSGQLTKHNIEDAKEEQRKIVREIKIIKDNLDSIISNTNNINTVLDEKINYNRPANSNTKVFVNENVNNKF